MRGYRQALTQKARQGRMIASTEEKHMTDKILLGVKPDLIKVVERALELSPVRFRVTEGLRSLERQKMLFDARKSKTMNSRHITGDAVDVVALKGRGQVSWVLEDYYPIAKAFAQASHELTVPIRWGGCWQVLSLDTNPETAIKAYASECAKRGKKPLVDAVHFELPEF